MKFKNKGSLKNWLLVGFAIIVSNIPLSHQAGTLGELKNGINGGNKELSCYVCNSIVDNCQKDSLKGREINCNSNKYLETVYGNDAIADDSQPLDRWPPSWSDIANNPDPKPGWVYHGFPSAFKKSTSGQSTSSSSTPRIFNPIYDSKVYEKGFKSCRLMKISTKSPVYVNGRSSEIPEDNPRIIRSCSFQEKGGEGYDDSGCKTFEERTFKVEVCYCTEKNCNGSSYLRMSQYWIWAACILVFVANLGMNRN